MIDFSPSRLLAILLTFFLAGIVKGVTGMGLPTVAMGVLGSLMPPVAAASLLLAPSFVTNVWQLFAGPSFKALASRLWLMMAGIIIGTIAGAGMLTALNSRWTAMGLGAALAAYAGFTLLRRQYSVPARAERRLSLVIGLATGAITGATGVFVVPAVPFLQALALSREDLVQALGLSFTVSTIALAAGLAGAGALAFDNLSASALAIAPALLGMAVGQWIRQRISPALFHWWFLIFLFILGCELLLRPLL
jgi:uncharacterized protein